MSRHWTAAQSAAMNIQDKTLLVSAAAGSGKTATLTERIIRAITDPVSPKNISEMLIVTFTRAAAEELKSRIFSALGDVLAKNPSNRHLTSQLVKLGSARICTIDAFYLELVRSNFSHLGISASFRIADASELELLAKSVMDDTVEFFYETDTAFPSFAECFTGTRSNAQLTELLLSLSSRVSSVPEGIEFLRISAEKTLADAEAQSDFFVTSFGKVLQARVSDMAEHCLSVFQSACDYISQYPEMSDAMLASFDYDRNFCLSLLDALSDSENGYFRTKNLLEGFAPVRLKRLRPEYTTEESERYKSLRTNLHAQLRKLAQNSFSKSPEIIVRAMRDTACYTDVLYKVLAEYDTRMTEEKKRRSILDFNDIRRYTLRLLVNPDGSPTPIALQYADQFSDIYIDEYQDVDRVQDLIFRSISRPTNRFMVGDIKQSIYSFRGAEPQVFSEYRAAFPDYSDTDQSNSDSVTVFMSNNFRCDSNIIDFTNMVCSRIFSACTESIGYKKEDDLVCSKLSPSPSYSSPSVEVAVILDQNDTEEADDDAEDEPPEKKMLEAVYISKEIERLIKEEKKADGSPILAGDIAVLFRSRSMSAYVAKALNSRGILSSENDGDRYFESPDVLMVLCILNTVDNPHRDIFLTGALRSPIFDFTMDDIIRIRKSCDASYSLYDALLAYKQGDTPLAEKCARFDATLTQWQQASIALPVDRFLQILFDTDVFVASGLLGGQNESGEGGNLLQLYEYARSFEAGSFKGLYNFIEFINTIIEEGKKMKVPPKGASPDRVNLMTIHQSKGLEFPICFVCGTANRFNRRDQQASLLFEYPTGVAMKISDSTGFARINTPMREALAANNGIRQSEEEMRILYVALTRARERLYITAASSSTEEKLLEQAGLRAQFCNRHTLLKCNSYLDWILIPFADPAEPANCARLSFLVPKRQDTILPTEDDVLDTHDEAISSAPIEPDQALLETLKEKFAFSYPHSVLRRIPAKLSVSRLSPDVLDENDSSFDLFPIQKKTSLPDFFISGKISRSSAAERGTATHLFFQFCDFGYAKRHGIKNEIARLIEMRFIPSNIAELIHVEDLELFLESELMERIEGASEVIREQRFNVLLSPENFTRDENFRAQLKSEQLAVQGVIDLILIGKDGSLELYDYKTDRLTLREKSDFHLAEKKMNQLHGLQLSYYAAATAQLFNRPCDRLCIYSTHAAKLFDIQPLPLLLSEDILDKL